MSGIIGNNIVKDGLVLHLDAADRKSYPGSGTIWYDRSGNINNATLTNGPTFNSGNGGYFSFDGTDDYVQTNYDQDTTNRQLSWECWFWDNSAGGGFSDTTALISNYKTTTTPFTILHIYGSTAPSGGILFGQQNSSSVGAYVTYSTNVCDSVWHQIVGVVDSTTMYLYIDGTLKGSTAKISGTTRSGQGLIIAGNHFSRYQSCRMSIVRVYDNKALSAAEVSQNFNATRKRFNI